MPFYESSDISKTKIMQQMSDTSWFKWTELSHWCSKFFNISYAESLLHEFNFYFNYYLNSMAPFSSVSYIMSSCKKWWPKGTHANLCQMMMSLIWLFFYVKDWTWPFKCYDLLSCIFQTVHHVLCCSTEPHCYLSRHDMLAV